MKIFIAANPTEAHIVCELLKVENIACEVRGEGLFGLKGEIPFSDDTDPYVWLQEPNKISLAERVIESYNEQSNSDNNKEWQCSHCNELNEPQFGACWQCGQASPE
ncbi:DUF2007 domain-containing protein [Vibrio makurazakiensis]|uniref:putative signal transducing protein n=1 Tax=Vibrio makurazakiensis TaxID=2910250 RepID=UPI003D0E9F2E